MSASLILFIPLALLGVVTGLCFVGCVFQTGGIGGDPGPYRDAVTSKSNLIAFWPLDDAPPTDASQPTALDKALLPPGATPLNGTYTGTFALQVTGIVTGDHPSVGPSGNPCASFNGGRVEVPFDQGLNASSFTLECWVLPNWTATDTQMQRAVVVSAFSDERPNPTANAGYALVATPNNFWSAQIGIGTTFVGVTSNQAIMLKANPADPKQNPAYYLAMTFDGTALTLFVGVLAGLTSTPPMMLGSGEKFLPEQPGMTATSLFIAMGRPDLPTTMEYPFDGGIQDVAFYSPALGAGDIQNHFALGSQLP